MAPPARGELRCERLADDTLLVHLVGPWTIRAGAPVVTELSQQATENGSAFYVMLFLENPIRTLLIFNGL